MRDEERLIALYEEKLKRKNEQKLFYNYFVEDTPFSIEHYQKHFKFFADGATAKQRLLIAANRVGKTEAACFEIVCHAIGWYPSWWPGRKYKPGQDLLIWMAGDTNKTIRDILQVKLLGSTSVQDAGVGIIPKKYIRSISKAGGVSELVDTIYIERIGGGLTQLQLKSYQGGRKTFQGTEVDIVHCDEEPPHDIYLECLMRTLTNQGQLIMTFTPLSGPTELIMEFNKSAVDMPDDIKITNATWEDVPHLDEKEKAILLASIPEWARDSRTKGIPQLGSGAIYRVHLDKILIPPRPIADHWKRVYSLDVGWNRTAVLFGAIDPQTKTLYIYDEIYCSGKQPYEYAEMIKMRGQWIPGLVDSASSASSQIDGRRIFDLLTERGLDLSFPDKSVEAGLYKTWAALSNDNIKVFDTCLNFQDEYRMYRRDEKGEIIKKNDHLMDCLRYMVMSGAERAKSLMDATKPKEQFDFNGSGGFNGWMG